MSEKLEDWEKCEEGTEDRGNREYGKVYRPPSAL